MAWCLHSRSVEASSSVVQFTMIVSAFIQQAAWQLVKCCTQSPLDLKHSGASTVSVAALLVKIDAIESALRPLGLRRVLIVSGSCSVDWASVAGGFVLAGQILS
eukprot:4709865-Amphidinium_carterae.1